MQREQQINEANNRNLGKKKLAGYDEANNCNKGPRVLIQEDYICPRPAAMSTHSRFPGSFANLTVLGKKYRRPLEVASAVPWFWRKDHQSLPTFVSSVYVLMGGMSGKHSAELKTHGDEDNTYDGEINIKKWEAQWSIGYGVGSNGPRFESGRGRCVESLDKALYSHCPKEKPSH